MDTRKPEVIVNPNPTQLADVAAQTGVTVPGSAAAISVQGSAAGGWRLGVLPGAAPAFAEMVSEDSQERPAAAHIASEESLEAGIAELAKPAKPVLRAGESSLIGPPGSLSGSLSIGMTLQGVNTITADQFKYHVGDRQAFRSVCDNTFYVYWVDGSELPAHYLVILRQHTSFNVRDTPGILHDANHIRGFGMYAAKTEVRDVRASTNQVRLLMTSPDNDSRLAQVRFDVRMTQDVSGGSGLAPATMQEGYEMTLDRWSPRQWSAAPDVKWEFMQNEARDGGFTDGNKLVARFFDGQAVRPYPANASGLNARTYAAWRVDGGKDATFSFGLELLQYFMLLALGWVRTQDSRGGWLAWHFTGLQPFSLDLRKIVEEGKGKP